MKKILFSALVIAAAITGCDCKHGYGPDNCKDTWASNYVGTWQGTLNCGNGSQIAPSNITEESPTSIRIDGDIYATLDDWDSFTVPTQQVGGGTISGRGGLREKTATVSGGQINVNVYTELWYDLTLEQNGQTAQCIGRFQK